MTAVKDLLPIGSVVLLKNGIKELMITGIYQTSEDDGEQYDYIGVPYPEGNLGPGFLYLFDHEQIQNIRFTGYTTPQRDEFIQALANSLEI